MNIYPHLSAELKSEEFLLEIIVRMRGMYKLSFQVLTEHGKGGRKKQVSSARLPLTFLGRTWKEVSQEVALVHGPPTQGPPSKHSWLGQFSRGSP